MVLQQPEGQDDLTTQLTMETIEQSPDSDTLDM